MLQGRDAITVTVLPYYDSNDQQEMVVRCLLVTVRESCRNDCELSEPFSSNCARSGVRD